jgi:DNA replicative helicase MCM subunit Mcm2 (Cdc46/Mcm family)
MKDNDDAAFQKIAEGNPLDYLSRFVCPYLVGGEWPQIRKAHVLMMACEEVGNTRMRTHEILIGPPGTGKTELLNWHREYIGGQFINSELTSKVGLVGDARGAEVTPGLLADCDGNFVLCDELDKMTRYDQSGLLQAMEEGRYTITKGREHVDFKAEIRTIAAANNIFSLQEPLLDRFDFIFTVSPPARKERAENVNFIIDSFLGKNNINKYINIVIAYIEWVKQNHDGNIRFEDEQLCKDHIKNYLLGTSLRIESMSYRNLELSILRIAYAHSRLERKLITEEHVKNAIRLKDMMMRNIIRWKTNINAHGEVKT